jgi:hypothetical protein
LAVSDSGFSEELERFIKEQIRSLEQLEILLLLSSAPDKKWTEQAVYEVIKSSRSSVAARLNELVSQKLLSTETAAVFTFSPESETVKRLVQELAVAYKQRPVRVVELLYSRPPDAVQEFAKAFKLRKEP